MEPSVVGMTARSSGVNKIHFRYKGFYCRQAFLLALLAKKQEEIRQIGYCINF
jgi:hypothetical protein